MATTRLKPDVGDIVAYHVIAYDTEIRGKVIDLLSSQFTIRITHPEAFKNKTYFLFYNDDYVIV